MGKKDNWNILSSQNASDTTKYRDVYSDQQLKRSKIGKKQTMLYRNILSVFLFFIFLFMSWVTVSGTQFLLYQLNFAWGSAKFTSKVAYFPSYIKYHVDYRDGDGVTRFYAVNSKGKPITKGYLDPREVPIPKWWKLKQKLNKKRAAKGDPTAVVESPLTMIDPTSTEFMWKFMKNYNLKKILIALAMATVLTFMLHNILYRKLKAQNVAKDTSDINQYQGDQRIALPEEIMRKFDYVPDAGMHFSIQASTLISHAALSNKGVNSVKVSKRYKKDVSNDDGDIIHLKGEIIKDKDGKTQFETLPLFNKDFMEELFDVSGLPKDKELRRYFDPKDIPYNPGNEDRNKLKAKDNKGNSKYNTVADMINGDWELPEYETQRPAGVYLVDTEPVNTMILAITRAGKGQTYIEPMIDVWLRERNRNNIVVNDPKGELLVKFYVPATYRGYQVVQINLMNPASTDIFNPLLMACESAREGDFTKCMAYVTNITDILFPKEAGGSDPMWNNAAANAFSRTAYGLIDYYLEEEAELREEAALQGMSEEVLESKLDALWGKVTLYNCYQMFTYLSSKQRKSPVEQLKKLADEEGDDSQAYKKKKAELEQEISFFEEKEQMDTLSLFFSVSSQLPKNEMRTLVGNADNSLKAMGGADKMIASVYGIAITAMSFFTDKTISALTSGTPSQNIDIASMSFPRRFGVRLHANFVRANNLLGMQCIWNAYEDDKFTKQMGKDFDHTDLINTAGWARYYFKGVFPNDTAYLRLRIINPQTEQFLNEFFFKFQKGCAKNVKGDTILRDPVLGTRIVLNGILTELVPKIRKSKKDGSKTKVWVKGQKTFKQKRLKSDEYEGYDIEEYNQSIIVKHKVRYTEKSKIVFMITPPHLPTYARIPLILIKQMVDLNFEQSYMSKADQKPLYKTRFMLDELGNLRSGGDGAKGGIASFQTMLSIGLGQEQQFTLILQTLQQLKDVYGESVDKIVQGNSESLKALIFTPSGYKMMGDIKFGDKVLTPFGTEALVIGVYDRGTRDEYEVKLRDGSTTYVCGEHLWCIERFKSTTKKERANGMKTAKRVQEIVTTMELKERVDKGTQINLPVIQPANHTKKDLPIDPYILGVILGDANINLKGRVCISKAYKDMQIINEMICRGFTPCTHIKDRLNVFLKNGKRAESTPVYSSFQYRQELEDLNLIHKRSYEKFIPEIYLYGSIEQRLELLQGLMDTDGTISKDGEMEFVSTSYELAKGVQQLVRSLGGRVNVNIKTKVRYSSPLTRERYGDDARLKGRTAYRVQNIRLYNINPFKLERKACKFRYREDTSGNRVVSVELTGKKEQMRCIKIADPRHLYLTDDYIPTHNTSNIIFLKSTDDSMIKTLSEMSGKTHKSFISSKTFTKDHTKFINEIDDKASYTMSVQEVPVITPTDLASLPERNSIVFRAGDSVIWNRNEMILPMSFKLVHDKGIKQPGKNYSLQTIPTLSQARYFDVLQNTPDFEQMLMKRMNQAKKLKKVKEMYKEIYGYTDTDINKLDPNLYSDELMRITRSLIRDEQLREADNMGIDPEKDEEARRCEAEARMQADFQKDTEDIGTNYDEETIEKMERHKERETAKFGTITPNQIYDELNGTASEFILASITKAFLDNRNNFLNCDHLFRWINGDIMGLYDATGKIPYVICISRLDTDTFNSATRDSNSNVYSESSEELKQEDTFKSQIAFAKLLSNMDSWVQFGNFQNDLEKYMQQDV